jgi:hypothetical protein
MEKNAQSLPPLSFRLEIQGPYTFHPPIKRPLGSAFKKKSDSQPKVVWELSFQCESGEPHPETGRRVREREQIPFVVYADLEQFTTWKRTFLQCLTTELPATLVEAARNWAQLIALDIGDNMPESIETKRYVVDWYGEQVKLRERKRLGISRIHGGARPERSFGMKKRHSNSIKR